MICLFSVFDFCVACVTVGISLHFIILNLFISPAGCALSQLSASGSAGSQVSEKFGVGVGVGYNALNTVMSKICRYFPMKPSGDIKWSNDWEQYYFLLGLCDNL